VTSSDGLDGVKPTARLPIAPEVAPLRVSVLLPELDMEAHHARSTNIDAIPCGRAPREAHGVVRLTTGPNGVERVGRKGAAVESWSLVIAVAVTVAIGLTLPWEPDRISVTITNPTDHRLYIHASTPDDGSLSAVTVVSPRSAVTANDVLDRGPRWVLHLRTLGSPAGTIEAARTELMDGSFTVPISINDDLAAIGVPVDLPDPDPDG
jgi:hypothetical protein